MSVAAVACHEFTPSRTAPLAWGGLGGQGGPAVYGAAQMAFNWSGPVRELPLRSQTVPGERRFTAWRGVSGRRYVASVFAAHDHAALGFSDGVLLAVSATRRIIDARDSGPFGIEEALTRWRDEVIEAGASEIHVHLLADGAAERRQVLLDLMPDC